MKGRIKVATLFAGCGGDSLGFLNANTPSDIQAGKGFEIVYVNDKDLTVCNYRSQFYISNYNYILCISQIVCFICS